MNDEMTTKLATMRERLAAAAGPHGGRGKGYGTALRVEAVALATAAATTGMSSRQTAKAMGIHESTLMVWMKGSVPPSVDRFAEVRVVERQASVAHAPLRLVLANGARVEGLDLSSLVAVVRALA